MKVVAVVPPNYMPGLHYFQMMHIVDELWIDDEGRYSRLSWQDGNRIRTKDDLAWLRVPTLRTATGKSPLLLKDVRIDNERGWAKKHVELVRKSYHISPHFEEYFPHLESLLTERVFDRLVELDVDLIELFFKPKLKLETPVKLTSSVDFGRVDKFPTLRLLNLLRAIKASTIVIFEGGMRWLEEGVLEAAGITVRWFHPDTQIYIQLHPGADYRVSILDIMFSIGYNAASMVRKVEWYDHEVLEDRRDGDVPIIPPSIGGGPPG